MRTIASIQIGRLFERSSFHEPEEKALTAGQLLRRHHGVRRLYGWQPKIVFARPMEERAKFIAKLIRKSIRGLPTTNGVARGVAEQDFGGPKECEWRPEVFGRPGHWRTCQHHATVGVGRDLPDGSCQRSVH
jgi:hypothetical protein